MAGLLKLSGTTPPFSGMLVYMHQQEEEFIMKKALISALAALALVITGCGTSQTGKSAQAGPDIAKIVKASATAQAQQKNTHMQMATTMKADSETMHVDMNADFVIKPLQMLGEYQVTGAGQDKTLSLYLDEQKTYVKTGTQWVDGTAVMQQLINPASFKSQLNGGQIKSISSAALKQAKLKRAKTTDTVTMHFTGKQAQAIMKQGKKALANNQVNALMKDAKFKTVDYQLVIDRATKLPQKFVMGLSLTYQGKPADEQMAITYSNWGKVTVTAPTID